MGRNLTYLVLPSVLAIYLDPDQPDDIVEAYTFTIKYFVEADGSKVRRTLALGLEAVSIGQNFR